MRRNHRISTLLAALLVLVMLLCSFPIVYAEDTATEIAAAEQENIAETEPEPAAEPEPVAEPEPAAVPEEKPAAEPAPAPVPEEKPAAEPDAKGLGSGTAEGTSKTLPDLAATDNLRAYISQE